ncbi:hypothetical protein NE236_41705 [Actinoallomurus purpureus]|uniref:hypothetical protein n=1 Tax=Actinoallomurus purpureus TaxID=478114 RepID=UPI0020926666|nr:hypothetical protein [Actinoallomurus purpureus]MCO6011486.1 hypothetical protein [Actinoallomurus purpureus]
MTGPGRPEFLPPEDPLPAASPSPEHPVRPEAPVRPTAGPRRTWIVALLIAAVVAVVLGWTGALHKTKGHDRPVAAPSSAPPGPTGPEYATLPDPCTAAGDALPSDVRSVKPLRGGDSCGWSILHSDRSRTLEIVFDREDTDSLGSGTAKVARNFDRDYAYAADTSENGGYEHDPERLGGLGDDAFAAQAFTRILAGPTKTTARSYDMGGAKVEARTRNVIITVTWRGADYPPGARDEKNLVGTRFAYPAARRQALAVMAAVLTRFH